MGCCHRHGTDADRGWDRQSCSVGVSHRRDTPRLGWNSSQSGSQVVALSHPPPVCGLRGHQEQGLWSQPDHLEEEGWVLCWTRAPFWRAVPWAVPGSARVAGPTLPPAGAALAVEWLEDTPRSPSQDSQGTVSRGGTARRVWAPLGTGALGHDSGRRPLSTGCQAPYTRSQAEPVPGRCALGRPERGDRHCSHSHGRSVPQGGHLVSWGPGLPPSPASPYHA